MLRLLKRGKHWVLVTLLLGNVITNETLPIVLDRSLGGGWPAVLGSTVLIVIFGEIIPQSVCVRYGLPIGSWMAPLVVVLMYILGLVAWPTAKLLDLLLGKDHGTTYKRAGLKTLVTLHKSMGEVGEQLNEDEVTIIGAVLELKAKRVGTIMTPINKVYTMSADEVLDEKTVEEVLNAGYSRIPIHAPDNPNNYIGMLLVKVLITYDPEDCNRVRDFALATLPETRKETSCLDIINFFQEGKSHMVLVSEFPGEDHGALGVVTLEDVIEELIGEEIVDESDIFVDVHKGLKRPAPAPQSRVPEGEVVANDEMMDGTDESQETGFEQKLQHSALRRVATADGVKASSSNGELSTSPKRQSVRRTSSTVGPEGKEQSRKLGPSNLASRPKQTRYNTVKIKPGFGSTNGNFTNSTEPPKDGATVTMDTAPQGGVGEGLLKSAGKDAQDGVIAVQQGYGTVGTPPRTPSDAKQVLSPHSANTVRRVSTASDPSRGRRRSQSTVGSMKSFSGSRSPKQGVARSGSITEKRVQAAGGFKKTVLETTSSSSEVDAEHASEDISHGGGGEHSGRTNEDSSGAKKKRRRKKRKGGSSRDADDENRPLLG